MLNTSPYYMAVKIFNNLPANIKNADCIQSFKNKLIHHLVQHCYYSVKEFLECTSDFNRGKLMNIGALESQKLVSGGWQCYIFHDVDLLPTDTRNLYSCPKQPRHLSAAIDKFNYKLPYKSIFGGVSAMTTEQFSKVNGFSNNYWGWGGEDDDMYKRLNIYKYNISRYNMTVARYIMLKHEKSPPSPTRFKLLKQTNKTYQNDGLNTLEYELVQMIRHHLYTYLLVNIDEHR